MNLNKNTTSNINCRTIKWWYNLPHFTRTSLYSLYFAYFNKTLPVIFNVSLSSSFSKVIDLNRPDRLRAKNPIGALENVVKSLCFINTEWTVELAVIFLLKLIFTSNIPSLALIKTLAIGGSRFVRWSTGLNLLYLNRAVLQWFGHVTNIFIFIYYTHSQQTVYLLSFEIRLLTQNPCLLRCVLKETWLMFKRHDKMLRLPSLLIMHSCFYFIDTSALINVISVMYMSMNVWSPANAEREVHQINRIKFITCCFDFAEQELGICLDHESIQGCQ